ncbi:MAG: outer membrane lipoprotein-sorting protein [Bacteroidales bacterium]|nr:outer membrane lipoprotein-sorting protein [Deltaproteobacteria bacterium]MBL7137799.1 outer membrane lipoprotein-sorting protein [Bacteroidales bacterium]
MLAFYHTQAQDATEIIKKANDKMEGVSSEIEMVMTVVRPTWERTVSFKSWAKGRDYSLTLITAPPKESGQSFLKLNNDMWSWNPTINRIIKLPPSMMSQGWMGSDYTNDDILKEASIVVDYHHKIIGTERLSGFDCYKIQLDPKEEAAVVWGKILMWISKEEYYQLRIEYYDEDGYLVKTHLLSDIKFMYDRKIPTHFEIIPEDKPNQKTLVDIQRVKFDIKIPESFFSQQNMKTVK